MSIPNSSYRLINFQRFRTHGSLPLLSKVDITTNADSIDRESSIIIYISHSWLGKALADDCEYTKYKLCIEGIDKLLLLWAPSVKECFLWMDCACSYPDEFGSHLVSVLSQADCMFTPVSDSEIVEPPPVVCNYFVDYENESWNLSSDCYLNDAWCRLEMLLNAVLPYDSKSSSAIQRRSEFRNVLQFYTANERRPHFLFGSHESTTDLNPIVLPPLRKFHVDKYDPLEGKFTNPTDKLKIMILVSSTKLHKQCESIMYVGETNLAGEKHGNGIFTTPEGNLYEGTWHRNQMHGAGCLTYSCGDVYTGDFFCGEKQGRGKYVYSNGCVYEGEYMHDKRNGFGVYSSVTGRFEGLWENDEMVKGQGNYIFEPANGRSKPVNGGSTASNSYLKTRGRDESGRSSAASFDTENIAPVHSNIDQVAATATQLKTDDEMALQSSTSAFMSLSSLARLVEPSGNDMLHASIVAMGQSDWRQEGILERTEELDEVVNGFEKPVYDPMSPSGISILTAGDSIVSDDSELRGAFISFTEFGMFDSTGKVQGSQPASRLTVKPLNRTILRPVPTPVKRGAAAVAPSPALTTTTTHTGAQLHSVQGFVASKGRRLSVGDAYEVLAGRNSAAVVSPPPSPSIPVMAPLPAEQQALKTQPRVSLFRYQSGDLYEGPNVDGVRHGLGTYRYAATGDIYCGDFENNVKAGRGVFTYATGSVYEGEYQDDVRHGRGIFRHARGSIYEGEYQLDKRHGRGKYVSCQSDSYEGEFVDDLKHGHGTYKYANGDSYKGSYEADLRQGHGVYAYTNGSIYEGLYDRDKKHGRGRNTFADGSTYEGDFCDGMFHGQGTLTYANGDVFTGSFHEGKMHGSGTFRYENGDYYEGQYSCDQMNGIGRYEHASGAVYVGEWREDRMHGAGSFTLANGDIYDGDFERGCFQGEGRLRYANGEEYNGMWANDLRQGYGVYKRITGSHATQSATVAKVGDRVAGSTELAGEAGGSRSQAGTTVNGIGGTVSVNGIGGTIFDVYEGDFHNNRMHGHGVYRYANGDVFTGSMCCGQRHGKGVIEYATGGRFDGEFECDRKCGLGVQVYADGDIYDGQWMNNKKDGQGAYRYPSGASYTGSYVKGQRHGRGRYVSATGDTYEGHYWRDEKHGGGTYCYTDGDVYQGGYQRGQRHGLGVYTSSAASMTDDDGSKARAVMRGVWRNGEFVGAEGIYGTVITHLSAGSSQSCM